MRQLHIVEGMGGSRRATDRATAAVVAAARDNGWTPSLIDLADIGGRLDDVERLVLCGGDGLLHQAIQTLAGSHVEVAIVPVGSGNDFARAFGIGGAAAVALAAAAPGDARVQPVDLLAAAGRYAATVLTGGYSGRVNETANGMWFPPGSAKYTVAAVREIGRLKPRDVRLALDLPGGAVEVIEEPLLFFAIGNTAYFGGGMQVCPGADPTDGELQVVTVGPLARGEFVRWLPKVFRGTHLANPAVSAARATAVTIDTGESLWADGEPFAPGGTITTVAVSQGALPLLVPSGDPAR